MGGSATTYTDVKLKYKLNKYVRFSGVWRNAQRGGFIAPDRIVNRFHIDAIGKYGLKPFTFRTRLRYQARYRDMLVSENGFIPRKHIRSAWSVAYSPMKKLELEAGAEFYIGLYADQNYADKYRINIGCSYAINSLHSVGIGYIFQQEVQVYDPGSDNILAIAYSFDLNRYIKRLKKKEEEVIEEDKINWYFSTSGN